MVKLVLNLDLYFWIIDRAKLEDDSRNQILQDTEQISLHREVAHRIFNGVHIATLMINIRKTMMQAQPTSVIAFSHQMSQLKDNITQSIRQSNWEILAKELKKLKIKVSTSSIKSICADLDSETINLVLQKLFDLDETVMARSFAVKNQILEGEVLPELKQLESIVGSRRVVPTQQSHEEDFYSEIQDL